MATKSSASTAMPVDFVPEASAHTNGFKNRIVGYGAADPADLLSNPKNWRLHPKEQQDALTGVLETIGWVQDVVVNKTTGFVVDGHLRVALALRREEKTIPVKYVELTDAEESLILATFDPISAMAGTDRQLLTDLLVTISPETENVAALLAAIIEREKIEMPGVEQSSDRGSLLNLLDVTVKDPETKVEHGECWSLGGHLLFVVDPVSEWRAFVKKLKKDDALLFYPGAYVALVDDKLKRRFIIVQPDHWIAGFILDYYAKIHGPASIARVSQDLLS